MTTDSTGSTAAYGVWDAELGRVITDDDWTSPADVMRAAHGQVRGQLGGQDSHGPVVVMVRARSGEWVRL